MELIQHSESIWTYEFQQKIAFLPGIYFPTRSTIIRLKSQDLAIISPGPFDIETADRIRNLGSVKHLIAPNKFHHLYLHHAAKTFPNAKVYGPRGLSSKNKSLLNILSPLETTHQNISEELEWYSILGNSYLDEWVVIHRCTKTLIVTDLLFNMGKQNSLLTTCLLKAVGCYCRIGQSKIWRMTTRDKVAYKKSLLHLTEKEWTSVIMAHGEITKDAEAARQCMQKLAQ
ncbi:MAG: DUF4336 domain-containing protein [Zetaproteobacteria bacterium]|nr:DUF4336 domain-containing protein [Zetaproteobacteria bacterium]